MRFLCTHVHFKSAQGIHTFCKEVCVFLMNFYKVHKEYIRSALKMHKKCIRFLYDFVSIVNESMQDFVQEHLPL